MIDGVGGDDLLSGLRGTDRLRGSEGNDSLFGNGGADLLDSGAGDDLLDGGLGDDLFILGTNGARDPELVEMGLQIGSDTIVGNAGDDRLEVRGMGADVVAFMGDGNDSYDGFVTAASVAAHGSVTVYGGNGNDTLATGGSADQLFGGDGDDVLFGDEGTVTSDGVRFDVSGPDSLYGGNGNDRLILRDGDIGTGGAEADTFVVDYYDTVSDGGEVILRWDNVEVQITDYTPGVDRIEIALLGIPADATPELVAVDGGTMIRFGLDDVAFLAGVAPSAIPAGDIVIFPT